ncbi:MAG TPA: hypothetical protein PLL53_21800, partial [Saprospiraceae bacterium]|nr:hypothetical protein [Saprospiraceae bacterium]
GEQSQPGTSNPKPGTGEQPQPGTSNPKSGIRNRESEIRNPKSEIRNPKSEIGNPKSEIGNPKPGTRNAETDQLLQIMAREEQKVQQRLRRAGSAAPKSAKDW